MARFYWQDEKRSIKMDYFELVVEASAVGARILKKIQTSESREGKESRIILMQPLSKKSTEGQFNIWTTMTSAELNRIRGVKVIPE